MSPAEEVWASATFFRQLRNPIGLGVSLHLTDFVRNVWPFAHTGEKHELPLVSFATFTGARRALANVEVVHALAYDDDHGHPDPDAYVVRLRSAFPDCGWFLYSTFSSAPGGWRFRPIFALSRPATAPEAIVLWATVAEYLADEGVKVDAACKDPSRAFFVPTIPPSGAYFSHAEPGPALDVDAWLGVADELRRLDARAVDVQARRSALQAPRRSPSGKASALERARAYVAKVPGAISGSGGHAHTFALAVRLVRGFGLDDAAALSLLVDWNTGSKPPWTRRELERKVTQARTAGRLPEGFLRDAERGRPS